jgi:hypothetical protein
MHTGAVTNGWSKLTGGVYVQGFPPARPAGVATVPLCRSGTSGSRSGMSKWTGPALAVRDPVAAATTRQVADRQVALKASIRSPASSASPRLMVARTWVPK